MTDVGHVSGLDGADGELLFNPFEPGFFDDPYSQYGELRRSDPVHQSPLGIWILFGYDDSFDLLRDPALSVDFRNLTNETFNVQTFEGIAEESGLEPGDREINSILFLDPPDHTRLRKLVSHVFTPRRIESLRPLVQRLVDEQVEAAAERGEIELISELAFPLPFRVISEMLGMPREEAGLIRDWSGAIVKTLDPVLSADEARAALDAQAHLLEHLTEVIDWKRRNLADDLLTALIRAEVDGDVLSDDELIAQVSLLFVAGHETTVNLIGNGVLALLRNRRQFEIVHSDPDVTVNAVDELLRFDSPVQFTRRITKAPVEIGDKLIPPGTFVMTCLGSANRDPAKWGDDASVLDVRREGASHHLAFGSGIHHCLGAALARMEGQVAIGSLARRFPDLELASDDRAWNGRIVLRGLTHLELSLGGS